MGKLLYIQASPRGERSYSVAAADAFVETYRETHPEDEVLTLNIFEKDLPDVDGPALNAKYAILHGTEPSDEERNAWQAIEEVIADFKSADKYVLAVPMWNFSVPYRLKHYIDILLQPTYTFSFTPEEGYKGLVTGKPVFIAYSRGGAYKPGTETDSLDFQTRFLELALGFIGFTDIRPLVIEPTLSGGPEIAKETLAAAIAKAEEMARSF